LLEDLMEINLAKLNQKSSASLSLSSSMLMSQNYDIFMSYQWNSVKQVKSLQEMLHKKCGYRIWRDETNLKNDEPVENQLTRNIKNSKVFLFCLTRKYYESRNCKRELKYAINVCKPSKPIVFLMLEELELMDLLDDIAFLLRRLHLRSMLQGETFERVAREIF